MASRLEEFAPVESRAVEPIFDEQHRLLVGAVVTDLDVFAEDALRQVEESQRLIELLDSAIQSFCRM